MSVDLERIFVLSSGAGHLLVATLVLALAPGRPLHRAFAALFAARGLTSLLPAASNDPAWTWAAVEVQPYFALAIVPLAIYAAAAATRPDQPSPRSGWATAAAIAALAAAYSLDHALFHTVAPGQADIGALQAAPGIQYTAFGPLVLFGAAVPVALAVLGLRLAALYRRDARTAAAKPWLLLAGAFLAVALFDSASRLAALAALLDGSAGYPWLPWGWAVMALPPLAVVPALLGVALLAADRAFLRPEHRLETALLAFCALAFFSGFLRLALPSTSDPAGGLPGHVLLGLFRLAGPVLAAAAFLLPTWQRAADARSEAVAWSVAAASIAAVGVGVWALLASTLPSPAPLLSGLAAAVLALAGLRPLVRAARGLAVRLTPSPRPLAPR